MGSCFYLPISCFQATVQHSSLPSCSAGTAGQAADTSLLLGEAFSWSSGRELEQHCSAGPLPLCAQHQQNTTWLGLFSFRKSPYNEKIKQIISSVWLPRTTTLVMPHFWMLLLFMEVRDVKQTEISLVCVCLPFLQLQKALLSAVS